MSGCVHGSEPRFCHRCESKCRAYQSCRCEPPASPADVEKCDVEAIRKRAEVVLSAGDMEDADELCAECGEMYSLRAGDEPTGICDHCAQSDVLGLAAHAVALCADLTATRAALERLCNHYCNGSTRPGPSEGEEVFADAMEALPAEARKRINRGEPEPEPLRAALAEAVAALEECVERIERMQRDQAAVYSDEANNRALVQARNALAKARAAGGKP